MKYLVLISFVSSLIINGLCSDATSEAGDQIEKPDKSADPCSNYHHCGRNETYSTCVNGGCFGATYCSEKGTPVKCVKPKHCYQGCICKEGYLRDDNTGACILEVDCPTSCGGDINAQPGCGTNCGRHCSDYPYYQGRGIQRPCPFYCLVGGCDCKPGYLFDDYTGKCVAPLDCTKCFGPNEFYDYCPSSSPQTCASLAWNNTCTENTCTGITNTQCLPACRCVAGYYRNDYGVCVPESECQCNGDPNAVRGCGINCGRWCKDIGITEPVSCIAICYENACDCKEGYYYDEVIGRCVLPQECSRYKCCKEHETYVPCPDCSPETCDTIGKEFYCPIMSINDCKGECRCEPGYKRNWIGDCITEEQCFRCTGPNEYYSCGGPCDNVCATLSQQNQTNCPIVNVKCNQMCYCIEGFARDENGICIPIDQCPKEQCPGPNEHHDPCPPRCTPETCNSIGKEIECPIGPAVCQPGCRCNYGYFRNNDGICVAEYDCPQNPCNNNTNSCNGDYNAVPGCGVNCGRLCSNYDSVTPIYCPEVCDINGCDCKKGYVFDETIGKCVHPKQCNRYKCSRAHEIYVPCPNCTPETCDTIGQQFHCQLISTADCKGECRCEPGYKRNWIGDCITEEQCLRCTGPNEYYSCGGACDNVCATLSQQNQTNCPIVNVKCNEMCYCIEGFARDENGICIPIDQCPKEQCLGPNQHYDPCPPRCTPETCDSIGKDIECPIGPAVCQPGCRCNYGYFRNNDGSCVPEHECPQNPCNNDTNSCNGDFHAVPGCGVNCGRLCSNYDSVEPIYCTAICHSDGCDCKKGYVFDETIGKCVHPKECNRYKCLKPNEVFDICPQQCPPKECGVNPSVVRCPEQVTCEPGCRCADGYLRNKEGFCVRGSECPDPECNGENEVLDPCFNGGCFGPRNCSEIGRAVICIDLLEGYCQKGCICKEGYLRNEEGCCIPQKECPNPCPGENEVFNECTSSCSSDTCASLYEDNSGCIGPAVCIPACQCQENYRRNENGECIPISQCPCKIGESYKSEDGCNTCFCKTGKRCESSCTLKACVPSGNAKTDDDELS